jgi:hypothetical protein
LSVNNLFLHLTPYVKIIIEELSMLGRASIAAATLLTSASVKASDGLGVTEGGTRQLGVNALTLDQIPLQNTSVCVNESSMASKTGNLEDLTNEVTVVIPPFDNVTASMRFLVSEVHPDKQDRVLIFAYSKIFLPSPELPTPSSMNKLLLGGDVMELGRYYIPATRLISQTETPIGSASPSPKVNFGIDITLSTSKIAELVALDGQTKNENNRIYMQAGLIPADDLEQGKWDNLILSEMDTVYFAKDKCLQGQVTFSGAKSGDVSLESNKKHDNVDKLNISGKTSN